MIEKIIRFSIQNKLVILIFTVFIIGSGLYSLMNIPIGAVPDITNNQVQVITTSRNLATQEVEKFLTYPVELEMANLPNVKEIRSISKFGLSVVTIVFDDEIGTYLPRQLIAEKIKSAEQKIPIGFGSPFMGPVTTGLGEIYQYVIDVDSAYRNRYSITDLRTIQDWVIKRQLSGIPGVVEVNTWGGSLKQYEVAVNPEELRAMHISIAEVYDAVEQNNSIAGGGYIEKADETYFIRGDGLATSIKDLENSVVAVRNGQPIFVKDVAHVIEGAANRFGAITGNGEGEKVLGQVMMLKDADSKKVIEAVKVKVAEIEKNLPPGLHINGFLERSELIEKTTFTVAENLILGCLIVIFVVVLLLGNLRSGLVVASVIPLCLFFALTLMYIFGVDANLMSLGAIDFGIIIDGAVIIVEYIAFKITAERIAINGLDKENRQSFIDKVTFGGTTKMMRSAIFGQIIIIIVFIPILSLVNVEGKMFRPMALVFCFALIGAMLLCFTYVPVMAALFLKPTDPNKKNISTRFVGWLGNIYQPIIRWALRKKGIVLGGAGVLLVLVFMLFQRMGGEFVPTLDEGDLVIQPVLKTGTSLTKTIETTTQIEQILLTFPEVDQVISRIGAAEVPTDPMSLEESDVMVKLKPKSEWVTADNKDDLTNAFKDALMVIPGIDYEFTQPIEMRFNELITGVRADLAIKIVGEDLDILYKKALEVEDLIQNVEGAADISVEKVSGLPQMSVKYDRAKMARYGVSIESLNTILTMGFAGTTAGTIFEGEKQFDVVVRFDAAHRKDLTDLERTSIQLADGSSLPFSEFAEIKYTKGPAKISRDNTKRRIVIGVNVRNRDLESVVTDVQKLIEENLELPTGYSVEYGGQFENLRSAKSRLMVAVPIALILIFMLLYFAFHSIKEALMIYTAIPLSAVGGVLFLYIRDLPFSISAGVGFIALFGIAVLNGIVLIEEFKELKEKGITNINRRILLGTRLRLRPVLLTAAAAALGFLPMAISTNAGAEIQRPLATVVIGGLITATLLTLIVLPVLYAMLNKNESKVKKIKINSSFSILLVLGLLPFGAACQLVEVSLEDALILGVNSNKGLMAEGSSVEMHRLLEGTAYSIDKTEVYYNFDQNNIAPNNSALNVWGISQAFKFPTIYGAQKGVLQARTALSIDQFTLREALLKKEITFAYYTIAYWQKKVENYHELDTVYTRFSYAAVRKFESGETNKLEALTAEMKLREFRNRGVEAEKNLTNAIVQFNKWIQSDSTLTVPNKSIPMAIIQPIDTSNHPALKYMADAQDLSRQMQSLNKQALLPDLNLTVFQGSNSATAPNRYWGLQAGIAVPLFYGADKARIKASNLEVEQKQYEYENYLITLLANHQRLMTEAEVFFQGITYYQDFGEELANQTLDNAERAYLSGEIDYMVYAQLLENANQIKINYLQRLYGYNITIVEANYILQ